jgi:hypothetical protein
MPSSVVRPVVRGEERDNKTNRALLQWQKFSGEDLRALNPLHSTGSWLATWLTVVGLSTTPYHVICDNHFRTARQPSWASSPATNPSAAVDAELRAC